MYSTCSRISSAFEMRSLSRLFSGIKGAYNDINPSTLTGAIDVLVVEQPDGSFTSGPFHVRFGKLTAISPADKIVEIYVNGSYVDFLRMRLGSAGDAYFVENDHYVGGSDQEECMRVNDSDVYRKPWQSTRRKRRRVRRDTVQSETDAIDLEFDDFVDTGPLSDCEQSDLIRSDYPSQVSHFASDSLLHEGLDLSGQDRNWDWSRFEKSASSPLPDVDTAISIQHPCESQSNIENLECATSKVSQSVPVEDSQGVYLEDLVTSKVDQTVKETYIYPPAHATHTRPPRVHVDSGGYVDAGYRSDGENSPRSLSPIYPVSLGVRLSLCGCPPLDTELSEDKFVEHLVTYEEFIQHPDDILANPNLTVQLNGKYRNWQVAAPSIISVLAFQTELPHRTVRRLENVHMRKKEVRRSSWFSWGTRNVDTTNIPVDTDNKAAAITRPLPEVVEMNSKDQSTTEADQTLVASDTPVTATVTGGSLVSLQKSNRLSSDDIVQLNLKRGRNDVEFRVTTKYQGTCICSASIFVWHWSDRVVISDVDGTITRSDVLGHLLPVLGHDWTQPGVARLYDQISQNGYRFLYLSTRALGQAGITRSYLRHVVQDNISLPEGPILLSPNSLLHAIHQEVIEKKPENFKIQCLLDVCSLFPLTSPFYAGFGNKTNDVFAYEKAGVEKCRIFTVNPRGEVRNEFQPGKITSYSELSSLVDHYFPMIPRASLTSSAATLTIPDSDNGNTSSDDLVVSLTADLVGPNEPNIVSLDSNAAGCGDFPDECLIEDELDDLFDRAVNHLRGLAINLKPDVLLYFYGRYKQVTVGRCNIPKPGFTDFNGRRKWYAWDALGEMSKRVACQEYVDKLKEVDPSWNPETQVHNDNSGVSVSRLVCLNPEAETSNLSHVDSRPIFEAVKEGSLNQSESILRCSPSDVNLKDDNGMTPLHWAADRGHHDIITLLLAYSADVHVVDHDGQTPLHYACSCGHVASAKMLVRAGASLEARDLEGQSAFSLADEALQSELVLAVSDI
ncbi:phosphatidate phosphatase LPIN [Paragonimus westermani]|uniref:Acyl-CoA-binding domain-containing protein 6 n=1 Tax=Paragonimus westermani TaxID=34504 RepID=A0A5J4NDB6_9TREM|nr:phosphatidate phosphatase LPIN [Paragonimus westermani]